MPTNLIDLTFDQVTADNGFFNENEVTLQNTILSSGTGVYKLIKNKDGQFTSVESVTEVSEDNVTITDGRVTIIGDTEDILYVSFVV